MSRSSPPAAALSLALCMSLSALACGPSEGRVIESQEPYDGDAFPDRRAPLHVPPGGLALVTNSYSDTLSAVAVDNGAGQGSYPVGLDPVRLDGPHHVAVAPGGEAVFVALSYPVVGGVPHTSHGPVERRGAAVKLSGDDLRITGVAWIDKDPGEIVVSQDGARLVTSHFDLQRALQNPGDIDAARAGLTVLDPAEMALWPEIEVPSIPTCVAPHGLVLSGPGGATAHVACYGEDSIAVVDLAKGLVTARVPVGAGAEGFGDPVYGPYALALSPDGARLAITNTVSKDLRFFDVAKAEMVAGLALSTLGAPYSAAWLPGARIAAASQAPDAVAIFDLDTKQEAVRRDFAPGECPLPHALLAADGGLLLACEGDHQSPGKLLRLDPDTLETENESMVGVYPDGIALLPEEAP